MQWSQPGLAHYNEGRPAALLGGCCRGRAPPRWRQTQPTTARATFSVQLQLAHGVVKAQIVPVDSFYVIAVIVRRVRRSGTVPSGSTAVGLDRWRTADTISVAWSRANDPGRLCALDSRGFV